MLSVLDDKFLSSLSSGALLRHVWLVFIRFTVCVEIFFSMSFSVDYVDVRWCVVRTASIEDELIQYLAIVLVLRQ